MAKYNILKHKNENDNSIPIKLNPTPNGVGLVNGISSQICFLIAQYLLTEPNIISIVNNMVLTYKKLDATINQVPSIAVYKNKNVKHGLAGYESGEICIELKFPLNSVRDTLQLFAEQFVGLMEIINLRGSMTTYCKQNMFGLWWLGKKFDSDLTTVYSRNDNDSTCVFIYMDYHVDLLGYYESLQANGFNLYSPDAVIYGIAEGLEIVSVLEPITEDDKSNVLQSS